MLFTSSSDGTTVTPTTPPDNGTDPTSGTDPSISPETGIQCDADSFAHVIMFSCMY